MPGLHLLSEEELPSNFPQSPGQPIKAWPLGFLLHWGKVKPGHRLAGIELGIVSGLGHRLGELRLNSLKESLTHLRGGQFLHLEFRQVFQAITFIQPALAD